MSAMKHATLALALLAGTALSAQAQTSGGMSGSPAVGSTSGGTSVGAMPRSGGAPTSTGRAGHNDDSLAGTGTNGSSRGTTGRGNPMPNNSDIGTGPAGPSVAGRSTAPGNTSTQAR
ncbi:hypothetical protein D9599_00490 [Roseomonas sp. KE2513]|uniref:hypothetical protein n=1 Tax=Roseomonas sp. KE2513 TaxID=2479202 RepID=UPI0018DFC60D|nr:hypothetical protein [Roseomonas sp. KE2513]MBI0534055.1 hypothetical protein [Roseomonas sp. KE2513]